MTAKIKREKDEARLPHHSRLALGVLMFLGVSAVLMGAFKILTDIRAPFLARQSEEETQGESQEQLSQLELQNKDTDQDGLSDWAELNLYTTSPYLADSDADGFNDKTEIDASYDPNCPAGRDCRGTVIAPPATTTAILNPVIPGFSDEEPLVPAGSALPEELSSELGSLTPEQIRALLLESGKINEATLSQIDDATLLEVLEEVLQGENL